MTVWCRYWLSEGIIHQLMAKARELEKNSDLKCRRVAERIFSGIEQVHVPLERCNIGALFFNYHKQ